MPPESTDAADEGVVVVEFDVSNPTYPFVGLSAEEACRVRPEKMLPRGAGSYAEFFSVKGADPDRVMELARENDLVEPNLISKYEDGGLFEFVVEGFCPARALCERGAIPQTVSSVDGHGKIVAEIPRYQNPPAVINGFIDAHPSIEVAAKETKDRVAPLFTPDELQRAVSEQLTPRQEEVLHTAYEAGYYSPTRSTSGQQLAEELGITPPTFFEHLHEAERKLMVILLEE